MSNERAPNDCIMSKDYHHRAMSFATLLAFFIASIAAHGQSYSVNEGFEGSAFPPAGWTVADKDGDGHCWQLATRSDATTSGQQTAISYTVDPSNPIVSYGEQENYLITPRIDVTNETFMLSFKYCAQDLDSPELMEVRISETGNRPEDFTTELVSEVVDNGYDDYPTMQSMSRSLGNYAGKSIYIAFVHRGSGSYALGIDDVQVGNQKGPRPVSGLSVTPGSEGKLSATIAWTNPLYDGTGAPLADGLAIGIYRDGLLLTALSEGMAPGAESSYTDNTVGNGTHTYSVVARTAEGQSEAVSRSAYVGEDLPAAVEEVRATASGGQVHITWTAPAEGQNNGYINPANITYTVGRTTPGGTETIAEGISETQYTDAEDAPGVLRSYTVTPANATGAGKPTASNSVISYGSDLKDITAGTGATLDYANPYLPFDFGSRHGAYEALFYPSDLMFAKGTIKHIVLKNSFSPNSLDKPIRIWMAETDMQTLDEGWVPTSEMTPVFDGTVTFPNGENDIPFELSAPFEYTGRNLLVFIQMDFAQGTGGYFSRFFIEPTPDRPGRTRSLSSYDAIDATRLAPTDGSLYSDMLMTRFVVEADGVATLRGTVTDKATGKPVAGASVDIPAYGLSSATADDGSYSFYIVPSGTQGVSITATGFLPFDGSVEVQDGGEQTADFAIEPMPTVAVTGKVVAGDTGKPIAGASIKAEGYSSNAATTAADGSFRLEGIYAGEAYTVSIEQPLYDIVSSDITPDADVELGTVTLARSLISAYGVTAAVSPDGTRATIEWKDPASRTGRTMWTRWGDSDTNDDTSGDYYTANYNVAHAFTAADTEDSMMVGQSFLRLRAFIKASEGSYTATIWKGNRDNNVVLASKEIPASEISPDGAWVTVDFDAPGVEIKPGTDYLVGISCKGAPSDAIGVAGYGSDIEGKNNLKWSDETYLYNGYYAWNISAYCGIPGTELPVATDTGAPACTYNVYRAEATAGATPVRLNAEPLQALTLTDADWGQLTSGKYIYTVKAVYGGDTEAAGALSDTVARAVNIDAGVTSFASPVKQKDPQQAVEVTVRVVNYGEKPLTEVPVFFSVNGSEPTGKTFAVNLNKGDTADIAIGTADVARLGLYLFEAYTDIDGDEATANDTASFTLPNYKDVGLRAYRWDAYGNAGIMRLHTNIPEQAEFIKELTPGDALINAGEHLNGKVYAYTSTWYSEPRQFVVLDTATWAPVTAVPTDDFMQDMAYDYSTSTMYGIRTSGNGSELVTIDLGNGTATPIGPAGANLHALACSTDGRLYALTDGGELCTVDKSTAATATVGSTGIADVAYLQSMAFDHNTGRLFWAHTGEMSQGELYEVDPASAMVIPLGTTLFGVQPSELVCLYTPYVHVPDGISDNCPEAGEFCVRSSGNGILTVSMPLAAGQKANVRIVNMAGMTVATATVSSASATIEARLAPGVYMAVGMAGDGKAYKAKPFAVR